HHRPRHRVGQHGCEAQGPLSWEILPDQQEGDDHAQHTRDGRRPGSQVEGRLDAVLPHVPRVAEVLQGGGPVDAPGLYEGAGDHRQVEEEDDRRDGEAPQKEAPVVETPLHFRRATMIRWDGWKNTIWYCPARLNGRNVFLHDWKTRPRSRLEIVADIKLRDAFGLTDGDPVEVWIPSEYLAHVGHLSRWQRFKLDHQATWEAVAKVLRQLNTGLRFPSTRRPGDADAG